MSDLEELLEVIMPKDVLPKDSLYYKGFMVLSEIKKKGSIKFSDLVFNLREEISVNALILTLDWLYLLNAAILDEEGVVSYVFKES